MVQMISRRMTFQPHETWQPSFLQRIPARDRSRYLADALREKLSRDQILIEACRVGNNDPELRQIEKKLTW
jgi:hypothetical protein